MATPTTLLTLPLEIRNQIYSYMLLNDFIIDMIAANVTRPQEHGLFLTCHQLHFEAFEYYYDVNTFQLSLSDPTYSPNEYLHGDFTLMKRLGDMRNLHVEIGAMERESVGVTSCDVNVLRHEVERRWARFVQQLTHVHEGQVGPLLRSLIVVERCIRSHKSPLSKFSDEKPIQPPIALSMSKEMIMVLARLVEPLKDKVGKITIEIRSRYVWTPVVPIGDYPYEVLASAAVPPS